MFDWLTVGFVRGFGTVLVFVAFFAMLIWVYSDKQQKGFEDAAKLPLDGDN
jgi:cytochrome c oxidase cbb3-type subunit 4